MYVSAHRLVIKVLWSSDAGLDEDIRLWDIYISNIVYNDKKCYQFTIICPYKDAETAYAHPNNMEYNYFPIKQHIYE